MAHTPTTAAIVVLVNPRFEDAVGAEDPDTITMDMVIRFNGTAAESGDAVTFARNATTTVKNAAVRTRINALIGTLEQGVSLNNANIQISGLPV